MAFDLVIRGGTLYDGTGAPARRADVAVRGDRIVAVGALGDPAPEARRTIDATGMAVAPGFIDVHTHSDGWLLTTKNLASKTSQGFTTEILMSDGISYAPVSEHNWREWFYYLRALNGLEPEAYEGWHTIAEYLALLAGRTAQNAASLVPYANLRVLAAGWGRGPLDDTQINIIRRQLERALDEGAVGLSTGLDYIAECFATTDELVEVCAAMAPYGRPYVTHVRYKKGTLRGVQEAVEIGRRAGVPVHISHLKAGSPAETERLLHYVDRVAVNEVDFSFDIYPYLAGSTMFSYLLPYEVWEQGPLAAKERLHDPGVRERFAMLLECFPLDPARISLAWCSGKAHDALRGKTLAQVASQRGQTAAETVCDLLLETDMAALSVLRVGGDTLVEPFLEHPCFMLGTDGIFFPHGQVHPRQYGSAPRMLGPLVRTRKLFSLEDAVRKMTSRAAERFGLKDRGVVREQGVADLVVFDPERIADRATYDAPHQMSVGVQHVIVGGQSVIADGKAVETWESHLPGRAIHYGR
ncbi:MAG: D-aminoacylase [Planctomycetota bacterium]|nr:MAG: D-aminoacylase [Planctomycetota bacterium]